MYVVQFFESFPVTCQCICMYRGAKRKEFIYIEYPALGDRLQYGPVTVNIAGSKFITVIFKLFPFKSRQYFFCSTGGKLVCLPPYRKLFLGLLLFHELMCYSFDATSSNTVVLTT